MGAGPVAVPSPWAPPGAAEDFATETVRGGRTPRRPTPHHPRHTAAKSRQQLLRGCLDECAAPRRNRSFRSGSLADMSAIASATAGASAKAGRRFRTDLMGAGPVAVPSPWAPPGAA